MNLTYCLVTKGRKDFLPDTLKSLELALFHQNVRVVVIDNGCSHELSKFLNSWCKKLGERAKYVRFETNLPEATRIWDVLREHEIDWITFPGDDDIVDPGFIKFLEKELLIKPTLIALASSMEIIDSNGKKTSEIRYPSEFSGDLSSYFGRAFSEPPFLFPGLFFKFDEVRLDIPRTRYVFDWWLSLVLISIGEFATTAQTSISYRVHKEQESFLAANRRKYFEAQIILSRFINSNIFDFLIRKTQIFSVEDFWSAVLFSKPIYQDQEFGQPILFLIAEKLIGEIRDPVLAEEILGGLAAAAGVFLYSGEIRSISPAHLSFEGLSFQNIQLVPRSSKCGLLNSIIRDFNHGIESPFKFFVGCKHVKNGEDFAIDCDQVGKPEKVKPDQLLHQLTNFMETSGQLSFKISPMEKSFLIFIRNAKNLISYRLKHFIKNFVSISRRV